MVNKQFLNSVLYSILFVAIFVLLQIGFNIICASIYAGFSHQSVETVMAGLSTGEKNILLCIINALSSIFTIILFLKLNWAIISTNYIKSRPWAVLTWAILLAIGSILPFEYIYEHINLTMPKQNEELFKNIMKEPWGYIFIGILAPVTEELVFRGAILRLLLKAFKGKQHWVGIIISAFLFGFIHFNLAQGIHAFIIGLILGWMYYRTYSIIPGVIVHWVNNTIAYIMFHIMPEISDGKLIDLFHGNNQLMYGGIFFSLCIFIPSLFQLALHQKKA